MFVQVRIAEAKVRRTYPRHVAALPAAVALMVLGFAGFATVQLWPVVTVLARLGEARVVILPFIFGVSAVPTLKLIRSTYRILTGRPD